MPVWAVARGKCCWPRVRISPLRLELRREEAYLRHGKDVALYLAETRRSKLSEVQHRTPLFSLSHP